MHRYHVHFTYVVLHTQETVSNLIVTVEATNAEHAQELAIDDIESRNGIHGPIKTIKKA